MEVPYLKAHARRSAVALAHNVEAMAERFGLHRLGFLTLTFADHVLDARGAQRRLNSLATHVLRVRYPDGYIRVMERQRSGRIHYHLLVVLPFDVRSGVDFAAFAQGDYRTAGAKLRAEWAFWRVTAEAYRFGRTELLPIRSTAEGIGRYVGKYISKNHLARGQLDRGVRLVDYSGNARVMSTRFGYVTDGGVTWRRKVRLFAAIVSEASGVPVRDLADLRARLGPRWAYRHRRFIAELPDGCHV